MLLEYDILEYLKNAKKTDKPVRYEEEILCKLEMKTKPSLQRNIILRLSQWQITIWLYY